MADHTPRGILTLALGWSSATGGAQTLNRELCLALAADGHDVTTRVAEQGMTDPTVQVQCVPPIPGIEDFGLLLHAGNLPTGIGTIIGHSWVSGGAAGYLRDNFYPNATLVQFIHNLTDDLGRYRGSPADAERRSTIERQLVGNADLAVGVGPLLTDEAARLARMSPRPPVVHELIPGVTLQPPPQYLQAQRRLNLLVIGRADDPLKGAHLAANITALLRDRGLDVQLTVRGADPRDDLVNIERGLSEQARSQVRLKPFTTDQHQIAADYRGADLVLMPSRHEPFGLVATEAIGHGVPVLVPANSGAGILLADPRRVPTNLGQPSVVPADPNDPDQARIWADHTETTLTNLPAARQRALALRDHAGNHFTWPAAARALHDRIEHLTTTKHTTPAPAAPVFAEPPRLSPTRQPARRNPQPPKQRPRAQPQPKPPPRP
jgi:glycosyltransferase involved in cell wall biosynthesis